MGAAAVAVIVAKEKHIVEAFRRARALDAKSAVTPSDIGATGRLAFRKLVEHAVLREAGPGKFYLDEPSWEALRNLRRRLGLTMMLVVILAAIGFWVAGRAARGP